MTLSQFLWEQILGILKANIQSYSYFVKRLKKEISYGCLEQQQPLLYTAIWKWKNMQLPIKLHNKRLVCKTDEKHFESAELMFFHLLAFHYLGQPRKILRGRREGKKTEKDCWCACVCVFAVVDRSPFSHWLGEAVCRWSRVLEKKKKKGEAVLQMKIWQVAEVILHCLLAAIFQISISNATSSNRFMEHIGLLSRGGGVLDGGGSFGG